MALSGVATVASKAASRPSPPLLATPHVPALDGVRGIAILLVLVYHFVSSLAALGVTHPLLKVFELGWCGVDVFFALSGFLITGILLDTKSASNYFQSFYSRRALRIFPLYYAAIAVVLFLQTLLPRAGVWGPQETLLSPASLAWPAVFLENVAIAIKGKGSTGVLTHYWSLAVEEHFYMLWPLLVWMARSRGQVLALTMLAIVIAIAGRFAFWLNGTDVYRVFALTPLRLDGLAIGAATAVLVRSAARPTLVRWAPFVLAGALATLSALILGRHTLEQTDPVMWLFAFPLVAIGTSATLVISLARGWPARLLSLWPLRWFGRYSFGLYVWHPIIGMVLFHSGVALVAPGAPVENVLAAAAFVAILNLVVAWASYYGLEKPFLSLKGAFAPVASAERAP